MRTLLNESLPPICTDEPTFSLPERTFPQKAVLTSKDDLVEVGLDGTVIATPGAEAEQALALERGMASSMPGAKPGESSEATPVV
jgi:hypothetical protein